MDHPMDQDRTRERDGRWEKGTETRTSLGRLQTMMTPMRPLQICLMLLCPLLAAAEDDELVEYVSIPKSMLARIDIELFGDRWNRSGDLEPSKDLRQLLMLSEQEASDLEALMAATRKRCVDLTVEHAEVTTGKQDHLVFVVDVPADTLDEVTGGLDERLGEILGPNRKELFDLVRHGRYNQDRLARTVFGPVFQRGLDHVTTVTYEMQEDGGWKRKYQYRNRVGGGGGSSSSSGGDLRDEERELAEAILRRLEAEGVDTEPDAKAAEKADDGDAEAKVPAGAWEGEVEAVEVTELDLPVEEIDEAEPAGHQEPVHWIDRADLEKLPAKAQERLLDAGWGVRDPDAEAEADAAPAEAVDPSQREEAVAE